ncbi:hypothetical protein PCL_11228 [Purpureocillium lilacinum]|uniref:Uncharacterized protein n=1 Tax=Purpureocillium lilacinum TaxID=33203 RepID=A0A2U3EDL0_PURLI|nr:hypothetical protein PCL_11228 [Purpureocillium lilacinum]
MQQLDIASGNDDWHAGSAQPWGCPQKTKRVGSLGRLIGNIKSVPSTELQPKLPNKREPWGLALKSGNRGNAGTCLERLEYGDEGRPRLLRNCDKPVLHGRMQQASRYETLLQRSHSDPAVVTGDFVSRFLRHAVEHSTGEPERVVRDADSAHARDPTQISSK